MQLHMQLPTHPKVKSLMNHNKVVGTWSGWSGRGASRFKLLRSYPNPRSNSVGAEAASTVFVASLPSGPNVATGARTIQAKQHQLSQPAKPGMGSPHVEPGLCNQLRSM